MSLAALQTCVARLCVDESFRSLFSVDAERALASYDLSARERITVRQIDGTAIDRFAVLLKHKRRRLFASCYPLLFKITNRAMERYYDRYYQTFGSKPYPSAAERVADFGRFMEQALCSDTEVAVYAADIARYERLAFATRAAAASAEHLHSRSSVDLSWDAHPAVCEGIQVGTFEHDVVALIASLTNDRPADDWQRGQHCCVLQGLPARSECRVLAVTPAAGALLGLCDGTRSTLEIVGEAGRGQLAPMTASDVLHAMNQFVTVGIVSYRPSEEQRRALAAAQP